MDINYGEILVQIAPVFLIMGIGFALRRFKRLTKEADTSLMQLVVSVLYPSLIFGFIAGNPALNVASNLYISPILGFLSIILGFGIGLGFGKMLGLRIGKGLRTFAFSGGIYNYGYIPIPLIAALFSGRETLGVLMIFNMGVEIAIWTVGIIMVSGSFHWGALKRIFNPPLLAIVLGLVVNAMGVGSDLPVWFSKLVEMFGSCAIPLALLLAGASLSDLIGDQAVWREWKIPLGAVGLRLMLLPCILVVMAVSLPNLTLELKRVLVVQAAMPAGIFPIVLARHYGGEARIAVQVVVASTVVSLATIPVWIQWGLRLIGSIN